MFEPVTTIYWGKIIICILILVLIIFLGVSILKYIFKKK